VNSLARHYDFDVEAAWDDLPQKIRTVLLAAATERRSSSGSCRPTAARRSKPSALGGFMPYMERRYREPSRRAVREELRSTWAHRLVRTARAPG